MIDLLFNIALNNVSISLALAIIAVIVGKTLKRPVVTHLLWLLVFVKLLIPPLITVPTIPAALISPADVSVVSSLYEQQEMPPLMVNEGENKIHLPKESKYLLFNKGKQFLFFLCLTGSMLFFIWSLIQAYRFHQLLKKESETAPPGIQSIAIKSASCLGLKTAPIIRTTPANISPMVWWAGGRLWLVIPAALIDKMETEQLRLILSHELAHISRWDYLCRWIEWLACVFFWWNPVVWWARHNLRANEEICCDELVLSSMKPEPYDYGNTLLKAIDILLCTPRFQMAMASNFNGGDLLKRRLKLIISKKQGGLKLRWLNACILLTAVVLLPLGIMQAKGKDNNELEHHLSTVEKKLDRTTKELSKELSQKAEFKRAYEQYQKNMSSNPVWQKSMRDSIMQSMLKQYNPLFIKLNMSKEEFEKLQSIHADRIMEIQDIVLPNMLTATDEEKAEMNHKRMEINNKYKDIVNEFLGEENSKIYVSYVMKLSERTSINYFMETVPAENRISDEQLDALIDSMYTARKTIYDEMGPDLDFNSSSNLTEENIARQIEKERLVYEKYIEACSEILPEDQTEQFKRHLERNLNMSESNMKTRMFMSKK